MPPKIGKNWKGVSREADTQTGSAWLGKGTHDEDNEEQEEYVGDVLKLEPQVLGYEGQRGVLGGPDLVARELLYGTAVLINEVLGQGQVEIQLAGAGAVFLLFVDSRVVVLVCRLLRRLQGLGASGLPLLLGVAGFRVAPADQGQTLEAAALDGQPPGCPSCALCLVYPPLVRAVAATTGCAISRVSGVGVGGGRRHCETGAGQARSSLDVGQAGRRRRRSWSASRGLNGVV